MKFRGNLAKYVGKDIIIESSEFSYGDHLLLRKPQVVKIYGVSTKKVNKIKIDHLWVYLSPEIAKYLPLARKVRVSGKVKLYKYKTGELQVGVWAENIQIRKYKKNITKKYDLSIGATLAKDIMDIELKKLENT